MWRFVPEHLEVGPLGVPEDPLEEVLGELGQHIGLGPGDGPEGVQHRVVELLHAGRLPEELGLGLGQVGGRAEEPGGVLQGGQQVSAPAQPVNQPS